MKVRATATATGRTQWIPEQWLDHPVLGAGFKRAEKPAEIPEGTPTEDWKVDQIRGFADRQAIDLTGAGRTKAELVAAIEAAMSNNGSGGSADAGNQ